MGILQCLMVMGYVNYDEVGKSPSVCDGVFVESGSFVWRYGDDTVRIRFGHQVGLSSPFLCYFIGHGIFSGCSSFSLSVASMPLR